MGTEDSSRTFTPPVWIPTCLQCKTTLKSIPKDWECPHCKGVKMYQPSNKNAISSIRDGSSVKCTTCAKKLIWCDKINCASCGFINCHKCCSFMMILPRWSIDKKYTVCKRCCVPDIPFTKKGHMMKKREHKNFTFGLSTFQHRYFELREPFLLYSKHPNYKYNRAIDLRNFTLTDVESLPGGFCLSGSNRTIRNYYFQTDSVKEKRQWVMALANIVGISLHLTQFDNVTTFPDKVTMSVSKTANEHELGKGLLTKVGHTSCDGNAKISYIYNSTLCSREVLHNSGLQDFKRVCVLGIGTFARVVKVIHIPTHGIFAMKILRKEDVLKYNIVSQMQSERSILTRVMHPFIIDLYWAFQTSQHLFLVLQFLSGGDLFFHLSKEKTFSESRIRLYAAEIALALSSCHAAKILFRDLKPENLVLNQEGHIALTDFGLAKDRLNLKEGEKEHTFCGTPDYMSPELILNKDGYTYSADWWSLGVVMFEMVAGYTCFFSRNTELMYDRILKEEVKFPKHFSKMLQDLIKRLLDKNPETRMQNIEDFSKHPFFKGLDFDKVLRMEYTPEFVPDVVFDDLKYVERKVLQMNPNVDLSGKSIEEDLLDGPMNAIGEGKEWVGFKANVNTEPFADDGAQEGDGSNINQMQWSDKIRVKENKELNKKDRISANKQTNCCNWEDCEIPAATEH